MTTRVDRSATAIASPLECIALPLHEVLMGSRRLDAEAYLADGFSVRRQIDNSVEAQRLDTLAKIWQPSRLKGITVSEAHGVPFLAATQVFDVRPSPRKWLSSERTPDLEARHVQPGWVLVTCSGTVGSSILAYSAHMGACVSHDLLRVQPSEKHMLGYIYTFLRTWHGRTMMRSTHYGNIIKHLEVSHLSDLRVPVLDELIPHLDRAIDRVYGARDQAFRLEQRALRLFADAMGEDFQPAREDGFPVDVSEVLQGRNRRLDAYAFNPRALSILQTIKAGGSKVAPLCDVATVTQPPRFRRVYGDTGIPYLSADNIFRVNPEITKWLMPATDTDFEGLKVKSGWILMACSGQIYGLNGRVRLATRWHEDKVLSHDMIRIIPDQDRIRTGYLLTALGHPQFGRPLALRNAYGTSIPHLEVSDIAELPIIRLEKDAEWEIADAAEAAGALQLAADRQEDEAVALLETELEARLGISENSKQPREFSIPPYSDEIGKCEIRIPSGNGLET